MNAVDVVLYALPTQVKSWDFNASAIVGKAVAMAEMIF